MSISSLVTIVDQVEIPRAREIRVRFAILALDSSGSIVLDDGGNEMVRYHRGTIVPGTPADEWLSGVTEPFTDNGYPLPNTNVSLDLLHPLVSTVHSTKVVAKWRDERDRALALIARGRLPSEHMPIRDVLALAGGRQRLAAPDADGFQRDSIVHELIINRTRSVREEFGLVMLKDGREWFRRFNRSWIKPGTSPGDLISQARSGLAARGDPSLTQEAESILISVPQAVHTVTRVQLYNELRNAQLLDWLHKHQESEQEGLPKVPPELSRDDALKIALGT